MMPKSEPGVINSSIQTMHLGYGHDGSFIIKPDPGNSKAGAGPGPGPGAGPYQGRNPGNGDGMSTNIGTSGGSGSGSGSGGDVPLKKKRGRPRKYMSDGAGAAPAPVSAAQPSFFTITQPSPSPVSAPPPQHTAPPSQPLQQQQLHSAHPRVPAPGPAPGPAPESPQDHPKRARGRPPGASNRNHLMETLGSPGIAFTPHVITVKAGEDVSSKIMSFSQNGPRAICILSANGALSNVTLSQPATSGGLVTYEGRFEILSLSGSFMLSDNGGHRSRTGGLSISLAGPDGRVFGGGVAGLLIAASPVQAVVASFDPREVKTENQTESMSAPSKVEAGMGPTGTGTGAGASSQTSHGTMSESSGGGVGGGSPFNHGSGGTNMHSLHWM